ncbi:PP2C family serine/threonine-protein phosphatase [Kitasatospora purpeofusca]|uniref:PP2C family protein-serine/threonine phosphatase n=1 Tax=Kitasatospora purpeofusca TaxID=67352 RepID=UPI002A5AD71E|nr:PP2C family serine/threonine-protein phosphatase [Kitasatospora purpeofusca]MDY0816333.1 PP2C family serine/threonine-protein phosphatase [Kitasatospora purpeofusca]
MPQQTVCQSCAEPMDPEDVFCGSCGAGRDGRPAPGAMPAGWSAARPGGGEDHPPTLPNTPSVPAQADRSAVGCAHCGLHQVTPDGYCEACGRAQPRPRDHMEKALAGVAGVSDRGLRHHRNEDSFTIAASSLPGGEPVVVAVVCDGVSSSDRPDEASETAVDAASESLLSSLEAGTDPTRAMRRAIADAADAVAALATDGTRPPRPDLNAPACTYVSAIASGGRITIGWVGDTRAYWIPDDRVAAEPFRLTQDDSWAARMVEAGLMGEAEAYADPRAHAITGWLGADAEEVVPHTLDFTPHVPGVLLVCTDGLWNYAEAATDLAYYVRPDARTEPLAAAQSLVKFAVGAGGHDNITVAVLPIDPPPAAGGTGEDARTATALDLPVITATGTAFGSDPADEEEDHAPTLPDIPVIGSPAAPLPPLPPVPPPPAVPPRPPVPPAR